MKLTIIAPSFSIQDEIQKTRAEIQKIRREQNQKTFQRMQQTARKSVSGVF
jgi:hypothetical protein